MASPGGNYSRPGLSLIRQATCKPNSVESDHSSRRRVTTDARQRPTRRFRHLLRTALARRAGTPRKPGSSAYRIPPYLVLLRVGFTLPPALRPERCALTAPFHPYLGAGASMLARGGPQPLGRGVAGAVSFLWHSPSTDLEVRVPDVIRHTALRSSDFPPPVARLAPKPPAATARSSCRA